MVFIRINGFSNFVPDWSNHLWNRIKIPFSNTLASTKGIKNLNMRFPNSNRKRGASQIWRKRYAIHAQTDVAATQWTGAGEWLAQIIRKRKRRKHVQNNFRK